MLSKIKNNESKNYSDSIIITYANNQHRDIIYKMRYDIYCTELKQYPENDMKILKDQLDEFNTYLVALKSNKIIGFVSITPPGDMYSIDKYIPREKLPFKIDSGVYEIRILTLLNNYRGSRLFYMLSYAAFKWIEFRNGKRIMILGKDRLVEMYSKGGLSSCNIPVKSGQVNYELLSATVESMQKPMLSIFNYIGEYKGIIWDLDFPL